MKLDRVIAIRNNRTVYRDGDKCVKVFSKKYRKSEIYNEALNISRIEETGLNIPEIIEITKINDKVALVTQYIKGKTLDQLLKENPNKKTEYLETMANIQIEINSKQAPSIITLKDKTLRNIEKTKLDNTLKNNLKSYISNIVSDSVLCHGDLCMSNIVISDKGEPYIIDWSNATQGNYEYDIAKTLVSFHLEDKKELATEYFEIICNKTSINEQTIEKWFPIVAVNQLAKGIEKQEEVLTSFIQSIKF